MDCDNKINYRNRSAALRKLWKLCDSDSSNQPSLSEIEAWKLANESRQEVRDEMKQAKVPAVSLAKSSS